MKVFELEAVRKEYRMGEETVHALAGLDLIIERGEYVAILGPSGSGKSTLMHILGLMDQPSSGVVNFEGEDVTRISAREQAELRADKIGFVFQAFNLLPRLTVLENVMLPADYARKPRRESLERAHLLLERVGLADRSGHRPNQLSGGQRQRVAIARALINQPSLVLADEPTGNLDSENVEVILNLLKELHADGNTIAIVTHDREVASHAKGLVRLFDGRVAETQSAR